MKILPVFFFFLVIFFLTLLQASFLDLNLVLLALVFFIILAPAEQSLFFAFGSGLFLDLTAGTPLGSSSLLFLGFWGLFQVYRQRLDLNHPVFLPLLVFLFALIFAWLKKKAWLFQPALVLGFLAFGGRWFLVTFSNRLDAKHLRLS